MNQNDNSRLKHTISTNIVPKNNEGTYEKTFDNESSNDYVPTKSTKYRLAYYMLSFIGENYPEISMSTEIL